MSMSYRRTPQCDRRQDNQRQRIAHKDQDIAPDAIGIQVEVMKGVLLQRDGVRNGEKLGNELNRRSRKRKRAKSAAQDEQRDRSAKRESQDRRAILEQRTQQRPPGNENDQGQQPEANHLVPVSRPDADQQDERCNNNDQRDQAHSERTQHLPQDHRPAAGRRQQQFFHGSALPLTRRAQA